MFFLPFYLLWFLEILGYFDCRLISILEGKPYQGCNQNTPTVTLYSGFLMKTRCTQNGRSAFPEDHCRATSFAAEKLQTLSSFLQWHELQRHSRFPPLWTNTSFCYHAVGRFSQAVFRGEHIRSEDQLDGELWSLLSLLWLMLSAFCLALLERTARGRQAWTSATRPRPHVMRRCEWHMRYSQSHTRVLPLQQQQ